MEYFIYTIIAFLISGNLLGSSILNKDRLTLSFKKGDVAEQQTKNVVLDLEDYLIDYFDKKEAVGITFLNEFDSIQEISQAYTGGEVTIKIGGEEVSGFKIREGLTSNKVWLTFSTTERYHSFKDLTQPSP
ncbi:MAG: hypothetical protein HRU19_01135 [Pseudobacteriovorax sp.]|nr:hypothetical protein [Pseudobacteriovorax sp.]